MLNQTPESGGFQLGAGVLLHRSGTIGTMTQQEPRQPQPPADPSGIEEPHDVLAADEFSIGTRDERLPPDPRAGGRPARGPAQAPPRPPPRPRGGGGAPGPRPPAGGAGTTPPHNKT